MYNYKKELPKLLTDQGQRNLIKSLDHVRKILKKSGAITMDSALLNHTSDSWENMAYVDRLVDVGVIREIQQKNKTIAQNRIFVLVSQK
ncbi:MAG: hypothetical protein WCG20_00505 [bacterium]